MNSSFSPRRARARCSATRTSSSFDAAAGDIDFDDQAVLQPIVDQWTEPLRGDRARCTTRRPFGRLPETARVAARGIEVGHIFYFGTKYSEPMKAVVSGPDGKEHARPDGLLWHRPVAPRRRADRGQSRRQRRSSGRRPSRRSMSESPISRSATPRPARPAPISTQAARARPGSTCFMTIGRAPRREIRHARSHRPALADRSSAPRAWPTARSK